MLVFVKKYKGSTIFLVVTAVYLCMIALAVFWPFHTFSSAMAQVGNAMLYRIFQGFYLLFHSVGETELLSIGISPEESEQFLRMMAGLSLPSGFICYCGFRVLVIYLLTVFLLRAFGEQVVPLPPFTTWRMPSFVFWLFIVGAVSAIFAVILDNIWLAFVFMNILYVTVPLFGVSGLGLFCYYLRNSEIAKILKWLIGICCVVFLSVSSLLWTALGILDSLFCLRQPNKRHTEKQIIPENTGETLTESAENKEMDTNLACEHIQIEESKEK